MKIVSVADVKARFSAYLKETESGPVVITRNGRPAAILLNVGEDDEIEGLLLAYSPKFHAILQAAREEIKQTGGIPHDEFWQQVDAGYGDTLNHRPNDTPSTPPATAGVHGKTPRKRHRKASNKE